jgi:hypothetical protein
MQALIKPKKISDKQILDGFLANLIAGYSSEESAQKAGTTERWLQKNIPREELKSRVSQAIQHRVATVLSPKALQLAEKMMEDKTVSARVRWDIMKTMLAAGAGVVAPKAEALEQAPKDFAAMTPQQLSELRDNLAREMVQRSDAAKVIEHEDFDSLD